MNIEDLIPYGKDNAVSRTYLADVTGLTDRKIRYLISKARREYPILNLQDGSGYYRPTIEEYIEAMHFYKQERCRALSILWSLSGTKKWLKGVGKWTDGLNSTGE
jgi:hypothetical protein